MWHGWVRYVVEVVYKSGEGSFAREHVYERANCGIHSEGTRYGMCGLARWGDASTMSTGSASGAGKGGGRVRRGEDGGLLCGKPGF